MSNIAALTDGHYEADTIDLSVSEISSLINSAARGVGFEWGEADEASLAATWLSCAGLNWADPLLKVLTKNGLGRPSSVGPTWSTEAQLCPIRTGIALADFATLEKGPATQPVAITALYQPIIVLPFVARVAAALNKTVHISWPSTKINMSASGVFTLVNHSHWPQSADIIIACGEDGGSECNAPAGHFSTISILKYQSLTKLALQMTVPTSSRSQAGAGAAGSDDN